MHKVPDRKWRKEVWGEPLEFWQIEVKDIADQKALPPSAYASIFRERLPRYQFTAGEVRTRIRFIAYAQERSFLSGCAFLLLLAPCLWGRGKAPLPDG